MSSAWENRYRSVVWGKMGKHPYWPCYIFDPTVLYNQEPFYDKAHKSRGKEYTVSFYGDKTMGFIKPSMLQPFNEDTAAEMGKQNKKMDNATKKLLKLAIKQAQVDSELPPMQRLQWYFEKYHLNPETGTDLSTVSTNDADAMDQKVTHFQEVEKEVAFTGGKRKREEEAETNENNNDDEDGSGDDTSSDSDDDEEVSDSESDAEEAPKAKRGRGLPTLNKNKKASASTPTKARKIEKKTTVGTKKVKKTLKFKKAVAPAAAALQPTATTTTQAAASTMFENESKEDRLARLTGILQLTSSVSTLDEKRALKTLDKIKEIKLTLGDMKESGIAAVINHLKSTCQNDPIREGCSQLFAKWKADGAIAASSSSKAADPSPVPAVGSSSTAPTRGKFAVDRVSKKSPAVVAMDRKGKASTSNCQQEEIPLDLVRKRAVRLLDGVIQNESISLAVENAIAHRFGYQQSAPAYFEAVSRTFNALKENEDQRQRMISHTNAFLADFPGSLFQMVN